MSSAKLDANAHSQFANCKTLQRALFCTHNNLMRTNEVTNKQHHERRRKQRDAHFLPHWLSVVERAGSQLAGRRRANVLLLPRRDWNRCVCVCFCVDAKCPPFLLRYKYLAGEAPGSGGQIANVARIFNDAIGVVTFNLIHIEHLKMCVCAVLQELTERTGRNPCTPSHTTHCFVQCMIVCVCCLRSLHLSISRVFQGLRDAHAKLCALPSG